jgi:hypothetical protein
MYKDEPPDEHQRFRELSALSQARALNRHERAELESHLAVCSACREIYSEYALISSEGMGSLGTYDDSVVESWDDGTVRQRLLLRIRQSEKVGPKLVSERYPSVSGGFLPWNGAKSHAAALGLAACVMAMVGAGAYQLGSHTRAMPNLVPSAAIVIPQDLASDSSKKAAQGLFDAQAAQIARLQKQVAIDQQELGSLRIASRAADDSFTALSAASNKNQQQLRQVSDQRDKLASQLHDVEQAYQSVQLELASLRTEHDRVLLHTTSLESQTEELTATTRDQERKLRDDEQFLSSDRDIRELMGARKLYIADVFDVDSRSRTRKPFGRVFYTQNKSLIFYAFDLEHEPGVKTASAFQVWGQRDNDQGDKAHPTNLGLLYMDSETNRRWVLRFDDPKQLAEIDAVFVTVEPHGGSQKPTGKPLLYALLRKEANHP